MPGAEPQRDPVAAELRAFVRGTKLTAFETLGAQTRGNICPF